MSSWASRRRRPGAHRAAQRQLAAAARGARERQVGDVGAGDEEHERRWCRRAPAAVAARRAPASPGAARRGRRGRLPGGSPRRAPRRSADETAATCADACCGVTPGASRPKTVSAAKVRNPAAPASARPGRGRGRPRSACRRRSCAGTAGNRAARRRWCAAGRSSPPPCRRPSSRRRTSPASTRWQRMSTASAPCRSSAATKRAAVDRPDAEHVEEVGGDDAGVDAVGLAVVEQRERHAVVLDEVAQRGEARAVGAELGDGDAGVGELRRRRRLAHQHELPAVAERQRRQQHAVDDGEDRRCWRRCRAPARRRRRPCSRRSGAACAGRSERPGRALPSAGRGAWSHSGRGPWSLVPVGWGDRWRSWRPRYGSGKSAS